MPRRTPYRAMMVIIACVMLLSLSPATAGAWMPQTIGAIATTKPVSRTVVSEAPGDRGGNEVRGEYGMSVPLFISGVMLGVLLGLLLRYRVLPGWQCRKRKQHDIDRLTDQCQALSRESNQGKNQRP
jgi:hypothetical protein